MQAVFLASTLGCGKRKIRGLEPSLPAFSFRSDDILAFLSMNKTLVQPHFCRCSPSDGRKKTGRKLKKRRHIAIHPTLVPLSPLAHVPHIRPPPPAPPPPPHPPPWLCAGPPALSCPLARRPAAKGWSMFPTSCGDRCGCDVPDTRCLQNRGFSLDW